MDTSIQSLLKMKKDLLWINAHNPIEKQSKKDWNTTSISKIIVQLWKFLWSFGVLSSLSTYVFITIYGLNGHVYILEIVLGILYKLLHDSQNVCGCLTLYEIHIELTSLKICSIKENITNTSSTPPSEVKRQSYI